MPQAARITHDEAAIATPVHIMMLTTRTLPYRYRDAALTMRGILRPSGR
jgi:hypothetical protein